MNKWSVVALVLLATLSVSIGEALLSVGMKQVAKGNHSGSAYLLSAMTNGQVLLGTALMAGFFAIYAHVLSGADFSFVLPLTAMSFLFGSLIAHFFLEERVTSARWVGTLIIMAGVAVVVAGERGQAEAKNPAAPIPQSQSSP